MSQFEGRGSKTLGPRAGAWGLGGVAPDLNASGVRKNGDEESRAQHACAKAAPALPAKAIPAGTCAGKRHGLQPQASLTRNAATRCEPARTAMRSLELSGARRERRRLADAAATLSVLGRPALYTSTHPPLDGAELAPQPRPRRLLPFDEEQQTMARVPLARLFSGTPSTRRSTSRTK